MKRWVGLAFSGAALAAGVGRAQMHVVKKPETVVRAVGVYEWTGELGKATASRFVPVTVFIDNQLQDAGFYLARPVPFALETGTIFEVDKSGVPDGTLELAFQRHLVGGVSEVDGGWLAYGAYKAQPAIKASVKKSGPISPVIVSGGKSESSSGPKFGKIPDATASSKDPAKDPDRPTMRKKTDSSADADSSKTAASTTPPDDPDRPTMKRKTDTDATATTSSTPADDPDRPTMKKKSDSDSSTANSTDDADKPTMKRKTDDDSTASTDKSSSENDPERPTLRKRTPEQRQGARKEKDSASVTGIGSLNDDPDRPNLHRGKPAGRMDDTDLPPLQGTPPDMKQLVAVSDAKNRDTHDFTRAWEDDAERVAVLGKMQAMARAKLAAYDAQQVGAAPVPAAKTAAPTAGTKPGVRKPVAKKVAPAPVVEAALNDEVLKGFTLSYGGAATYFYTASSAGENGVTKYVTVVAQQEPAGDLKVALSSVTDTNHLDRTPWMRLVDVVDVEASNRASLLMELRAQHSRQFAVYRVIGAQAEQRFLSGSTE